MSTQADRHLQWPPERFYWAVIDASVLTRRRARPEQLGFLFEPWVPQPLDELHVLYEPLADRRYLACAVVRGELEQELEADIETLTPSALPPFVEEFVGEEVEPGRLNLLTGPLTPPAVRRLERRWAQAVFLVFLVWVLSLTVGLERRARAVEHAAQVTRAQEEDVYRAVLGSATGVLPLPLQLEAELRGLRQTRTPQARMLEPSDAALVLGELLGRWPAGLAEETDSIHITTDAIHVQCTLKISAQVQQLASAVGELPGWKLLQPTIRTQQDSVRATIQLQREGGGR